MTLTPSDYHSWRAEAAGRDRAYADGNRAGRATGRQEHRRMVTWCVLVTMTQASTAL